MDLIVLAFIGSMCVGVPFEDGKRSRLLSVVLNQWWLDLPW